MDKKKLTYSEAMQRLEHIVSDIENERVDRDALCAQRKEARNLIAFCKKKLYATEKAVDEVMGEENITTENK